MSALEQSTVETVPVEVIVRPMLTIDRAIDLYLDDSGFQERTRTTYTRILEQLADRLPVDCDVAKVTIDDLRRFLATYRNLAPGTRYHAESVVSAFFKWLYMDGKIVRNPAERLTRTRRTASEDLDVTTVSTDGVRLLLSHAETWPERIAVAVLAYLGPRRHAVSGLRLSDYDRSRGQLRFREKGGKTIWKPIPDDLVSLLEAADVAGVYAEQKLLYGSDYLIPPEASLRRTKGDRDDRVIWRLVKRVASRAGVDAHVHALRAAFACFYLEENPGDLEGLKNLLGHTKLQTTSIYLRKLDKQRSMEPVRGLSWGVAPSGDGGDAVSPQSAEKLLSSLPLVGAGGFEPPQSVPPLPEREGTQHSGDDPARLTELRLPVPDREPA